MKILIALTAFVAALAVAGCDGNSTGNSDATVTGPTNPSVVVTCLGDTNIDVSVDCGDRSTDNSVSGGEGSGEDGQ